MIKFVRQIKTLVKPVYKILKLVYYKMLDFFDFVKGKNPLIPPRSMIFIGDGDYEKTGTEFLEYFKDLGKLKPTDKVLDVGCGIGRMSVPLTKYLSSGGGVLRF